LQYLKDVKAGNIPYDTLMADIEIKMKHADSRLNSDIGKIARELSTKHIKKIVRICIGKSCQKFVTVSRAAGQSVARAYGINPEKVAVVYNGVDTEIFKPDLNIPKKNRQLVFVGNTEDRKKGIIYLLQAMKMLENECSVKLTIIDGGAPEAQYAPALMEQINLDGRVTFARRLSGDDLVKWYAAADIAVVPSMFEGFGLPAAEAMADSTFPCNVNEPSRISSVNLTAT
jgi:glycosyltransferase involved in cell wall biosynthesis